VRRRQTAGAAVVDARATFVHLAGVVEVGRDDDVSVAVPIDVSGTTDPAAKIATRLVDFLGPCARPRRTGGAAVVDVCATFVRLACVVSAGANDDIVVSVAIDVTRTAYRVAELSTRLAPVDGPRDRVGQTGGATVVDVGPAFVYLATVVEVGADDDVTVAVGIDVAGSARRAPELSTCLVSLSGPRWGCSQAGG
jgi:hypothetical protein